jgi:hypothetical protein
VPDPTQPPWRAALLALGAVFLVAGLLWPWISRYFGRLPGDIVVRRDGWTFAFPIVTSLVVSALLSLLLWMLRK